MRRGVGVAGLLVGTLLAACGATPLSSARLTPPSADACAALPRSSSSPVDSPLAALALPCLGGGPTVQVGQLRGPALINLWASWCEPCRAELPAFERYARRTAGLVTVVGVNTTDSATGRTAVIEDLGLSFPMLLDDRGATRAAVGLTALPITLFVDREGRLAHVYNSVALDDETLARLAEQHLGVVRG